MCPLGGAAVEDGSGRLRRGRARQAPEVPDAGRAPSTATRNKPLEPAPAAEPSAVATAARRAAVGGRRPAAAVPAAPTA